MEIRELVARYRDIVAMLQMLRDKENTVSVDVTLDSAVPISEALSLGLVKGKLKIEGGRAKGKFKTTKRFDEALLVHQETTGVMAGLTKHLNPKED